MMNSTLKKTGWILLFVGALGVSTQASAQSRFFDQRFGMQSQDDNRRNEERRNMQDSFNNRGGEDRNAQRRGEQRMSPDERRALRQQIDEAGRDIYSRNRR